MCESIINEERLSQVALTSDDLARYFRHLLLPEMKAAGQRRVKTARVLCIGAGGLGSPAVLYLAAAGSGEPALVKHPKIEFVDDDPGKPAGINRFLGRRPIMAFGNSDGDQQMLEWTTAGDGARLAFLVHHTDAEREVAYDRTSHIGKLDKAWDEAVAKGWTVVSIKDDWAAIFPPAVK